MSPVPATIISDIVGLCDKMGEQLDKPSAFDLAKLNSMIKKIEPVDRAASMSFRGIYFSFLGEKDKSIEYHRIAIATQPGNFHVYGNFCASLEWLGEFSMAVDIYLKRLDLTAPTEKLIGNLLTNAYYAERDAVISLWLPEYHRLAKQEHPVERLMKADSLQDADMEISELAAVSLASGAFSDVFSQEEDRAWQHLQ